MVQFKVKVSRLEINVEQVGHGQHVILCLPGALGFIDHDFGPLASLFDHEKFTVVMWDPPGFGKSRPPDRDFRKGAEYFSRDATWAFELMRVTKQ
ncbi:unnamed protein product [Orchesella dallaii]|uniref:AB hydrolase-1 domain-containing protein n=1 Tax=Orchesella dallaii TaxID=48710 RepID=A0ABP1QIT8_9HEXA